MQPAAGLQVYKRLSGATQMLSECSSNVHWTIARWSMDGLWVFIEYSLGVLGAQEAIWVPIECSLNAIRMPTKCSLASECSSNEYTRYLVEQA